MFESNFGWQTVQSVITIAAAGFVLYESCKIAYHMGEQAAYKKFEENGIIVDAVVKDLEEQ